MCSSCYLPDPTLCLRVLTVAFYNRRWLPFTALCSGRCRRPRQGPPMSFTSTQSTSINRLNTLRLEYLQSIIIYRLYTPTLCIRSSTTMLHPCVQGSTTMTLSSWQRLETAPSRGAVVFDVKLLFEVGIACECRVVWYNGIQATQIKASVIHVSYSIWAAQRVRLFNLREPRICLICTR